jgi:peptidyl-prolyl cis-trans isomerase B (cyclophilin B)
VRVTLLPMFLLALAAGGCGGDGDEAAPAEEPAAAEAPADESGCRDVRLPEPRAGGGETPPTTLLEPDSTYEVVVRTNCGDFTIALDQEASPRTAASFVALAEGGFYADTAFHRIVPGFVIQGGDPTGTGTGGPGYATVDPPAADTEYTKGVVAMAKTAQDPPGTAGSQFFVVTAPHVPLPPDYAVVGTVADGLDVVDRIAMLGDPDTELPTRSVVVEAMEVRVR